MRTITEKAMKRGITGGMALLFAVSTAHAGDWQTLFNGKDLTGWRANNDPDSFSVKDGSLRVKDYASTETLQKTHTQIGVDDCSTDLSLRGMPVFRGLIGPIPERRDDVVNASLGTKLTIPQRVTFLANAVFPLNRGGMRPDVRSRIFRW